MKSKEYWIQNLNMQPHPEGGYYKEVYRAAGIIPENCLPKQYNSQRNYATSIFFLLGHQDISAFHRLSSDELWYFHCGEPLNIYIVNKAGELRIEKLGLNIDEGEQLQLIIPAGSIFGAKVNSSNGYTLIGCMVSPGFDFEDFELMEQKTMLEAYPQHSDVIKLLTKNE